MINDSHCIMKSMLAALRLLLLLLIVPPFAFASGSVDGLRKLALDECRSLLPSAFKPTLSAEWRDYQSYIKVCPLRKAPTAHTSVFLVSVFTEDYYKANPNEKNWKNFPFPLLISADDKCLARLPEHFPVNQPVDLTLSFGAWKGNVLTEIAIYVSDPSVGGDYQLPKLFWNAKRQKFVAHKDTKEHTIKEMECQR